MKDQVTSRSSQREGLGKDGRDRYLWRDDRPRTHPREWCCWEISQIHQAGWFTSPFRPSMRIVLWVVSARIRLELCDVIICLMERGDKAPHLQGMTLGPPVA